MIDSGNFRLLRRSELFVIAGQDQEDLLEMARSRAPAQRKKAGFYNAAISTHVVGRDRGGNHDLVAAE